MFWVGSKALGGFLTGFWFVVGERAGCLVLNWWRARQIARYAARPPYEHWP